MEAKISKKSYYLPVKLMNHFNQWCDLNGDNKSKSVAGAIFFYMTLPADQRELCNQKAFSDNIKKALVEFDQQVNPSPSQIAAWRKELEAAFSRLERIEQTQRPSKRTSHPKYKAKD